MVGRQLMTQSGRADASPPSSLLGGKADMGPANCQRLRRHDDFSALARNTFDERSVDFLSKLFADKRLFDNSFVADVSERVLISVSRYKQNGDCRIFRLDLARDLHATHARHCEIEQHQIDV